MSPSGTLGELVLNVTIADEIIYPRGRHEVDAVVDRITSVPYWQQPVRIAYSFAPAASFSDVCSFILASVDEETGYGGLIWSATSRSPVQDFPFNDMWVSDTQMPPEVDPRVLSDPHTPAFFHRCSVLPVSAVKDAVREFCLSSDGARPISIDWVVALSDNGARSDRQLDERP